VFTGIVSETTTPSGTTVGPLFLRVMVYVVDPPTLTVATPSVLVTARSAVFLTVLLSFTVLFAGVGSASVALTVAVFTYVPPGVEALTVTLIVITHAAASAPSVGRVHVTAFPTLLQLPAGDVTLVTVYWDGTVSATTRFVAFDGPALFTVTV
jgi:hypothetical protein